jgi:hypothetical protein
LVNLVLNDWLEFPSNTHQVETREIKDTMHAEEGSEEETDQTIITLTL